MGNVNKGGEGDEKQQPEDEDVGSESDNEDGEEGDAEEGENGAEGPAEAVDEDLQLAWEVLDVSFTY